MINVKDDVFPAYITKFSLTRGIILIQVELCADGMVKDLRAGFSTYYHGEGREWHRTLESALHRANQMRTAKLKNLQKQMDKIASLEFYPVDVSIEDLGE